MLRRMSANIGRRPLLPHPLAGRGAFDGAVEELTVDLAWQPDGRLALTYVLLGDLHALRLPTPRPPLRSDGLWRHTCFEAFVARAGAAEYWEYNFSPSRAWAAYHFTGYREGMAALMAGAPPDVRVTSGEDHLSLEATIDLSWLARQAPGLRLGLAAVIEDRTQRLSYWALAHPTEKPDFHHADGFVLDLGRPPAVNLPG